MVSSSHLPIAIYPFDLLTSINLLVAEGCLPAEGKAVSLGRHYRHMKTATFREFSETRFNFLPKSSETGPGNFVPPSQSAKSFLGTSFLHSQIKPSPFVATNLRPRPAILKPVVEAKDLGKKYGERWIFRNLSFALESGDCLIVTGHNGAGKSTLLKLLSGLERPSAGTLTTAISDYRTELSYCALEQATFATLTVTEHLELAAKLRGMVSDIPTLIQECGLFEHKDVQSQFLSSGLKSRLRIALAIQTNPKILLWDEPGVALDGAGKALIERVIKQQKQRGILVIATNDPDERRFGTHELELV